MQEPTLVILAAGMGSRFGGLKQIKAVDEHGHAIIDFSLFDAYRAGFRKVAFVIKHEIEMNAEFHRIARRDEKAFLSDQCKEIEENNRMGKTTYRSLQEN